MVTATGGEDGAGIGGGSYGDGGTITISDSAVVTATGGSSGAGIGGGYLGAGGTITISDSAVVKATGGKYGAGIGGGSSGDGGTITISGGVIAANGDSLGAGIGGGYFGLADTIVISGGFVLANGGYSGAGIGGGYKGYVSVQPSITGGVVLALVGSGAYAIGSGYGASTEVDYTSSYEATSGGLIFVDDAVDTALYLSAAANSGNSMLCRSCVLPEGYSLYIPAGYRLTEAEFSGAGSVYAYHTAGEGVSTGSGYVLYGEAATYESSSGDSVFVYGDAAGELLAAGPSGLSYAAEFAAFTTYTASAMPSFSLSGAELAGGTVYVGSEVWPSSTSASVQLGETAFVFVTLNAGYYLTEVYYVTAFGDTAVLYSEEVHGDLALSFTMPAADVVVFATFEIETYSVACASSKYGTVTGPASASFGSAVTVMVTPDDGYQVAGVFVVAGADTLTLYGTGADGGYTFAMPATDVEVFATFEAESSAIPGSALALGSGRSTITAAAGGFTVRAASLVEVKVYSLKGTLVKRLVLPAGQSSVTGLKAGIYLVRVSDGALGKVKVLK